MNTLLTILVSGAVAGSLTALFAVGLTLVHSASGIFNFAHGATAFIAALAYYQLVVGARVPKPLAALVVVVVAIPLLALALERGVFRALSSAPELQRIVGSIGLALALPALGIWVVDRLEHSFGWKVASMRTVQSVPGFGPDRPRIFRLGAIALNSNQLIVVVVSIVASALLAAVMTRTRLGLLTHAVVDRRDLAQLRGVDAARVSRLGWVIGSVLAALAGIVAGPLLGLNQGLALYLVIASSAAVIIARFRSLPVAWLAAVGLAVFTSLAASYVKDVPLIGRTLAGLPGWSGALTYVVLFGVVGLGKRREARRITSVDDPCPHDLHRALSPWRRRAPWAVGAVALVVWHLGLLPVGMLRAGGVERSLLISGLGFGVVYLSYTVVTGMAGRISLAQAAFVTAAQLVAGWCAAHRVLGGGFLAALSIGALVAAALGALVALPALRLGGTALAIASLALAFIGEQMLFRIDDLRNGTAGWSLRRPRLGGFDFADDRWYALLVACCLALALGAVHLLRHGSWGRAMLASRSTPEAAAAVGISPRRATVTAFAVGGALAGIGGVLLAYGSKVVNATTYPTLSGLLWVAVAVTWGVRRSASAVLAGLVGAFFPRMLATGWFVLPATDSPQIPMILFGLGAVGLANDPDGVLASVGAALSRRRERRRRSEDVDPPPARHTAAPATASHPPDSPAVGGDAIAPADSVFALAATGVRAGYGPVEVLRGVSVAVRPGEVVAVLGANGAGKSTLAAALAGSLPCTGRIVAEGVDVTTMAAHLRARRGLVLAPESRGVFARLSTEENLRLWLGDDECDSVYAEFPSLAERRRVAAGNLSGGEQQMLAIAPMLIRPPSVLIADEPTLGLAPRVVEQVVSMLDRLRARGTALVLIEEQARWAKQLADDIVVISLGRDVWHGPARSFDDAFLTDVYLGASAGKEA